MSPFLLCYQLVDTEILAQRDTGQHLQLELTCNQDRQHISKKTIPDIAETSHVVINKPSKAATTPVIPNDTANAAHQKQLAIDMSPSQFSIHNNCYDAEPTTPVPVVANLKTTGEDNQPDNDVKDSYMGMRFTLRPCHPGNLLLKIHHLSMNMSLQLSLLRSPSRH